MNITVFGVGYVGLTTGACLANLGHTVLCVDVDQHKIARLQEGKVPFYEPGLQELMSQNTRKGKLSFGTSAEEGVKFGEVIFNCVGTPSMENGSANLEYVFSVAKTIGENINDYKVIVNKSTVPPGTARKTAAIISDYNKTRIPFDVVSNPEFLREGNAIRAFNYPDKIVVGTSSDKPLPIMRRVYSGRMRTYLPIVETDWETAELIKYANNSFLATKISFINEIANICDRTGADIKIISMALGLDYRISPRFLNPGVGYGGSCFPKDVKALIKTAHEKGYDAKLLEEVDALNERQKKMIVTKIKERFDHDLRGKSFSVLGLSFKPKTNDMREAPSINIINELLAAGAIVRVYDPCAIEDAKKIFSDQVTYCASVEESVQGGSAVVLVTEWDEFRSINFGELAKLMEEKIIFDGRNIYEPELLKDEGFEYIGMGRK
ncbi:MAG TPA: UDP-glucose/GDP-mannose dehydrogenase family protein [Candidatus Nanoarchaeia archaeon]|nr:UDP-glucose/GDP-mannose dehydrogenase family protein [Candidatus Nanoarchaeia archaeon]